jgi:hypothetical protein
VPALSKWAGTIVGLTLIAIGLMGIYETYFEAGEGHAHEGELALAAAGGLRRCGWWSGGGGGVAWGLVAGEGWGLLASGAAARG